MLLISFIFGLVCQTLAQTKFKCSPIDGALDTYSFTMGPDSGIACVRGSGQKNILFYVDKLNSDGQRKLAVGFAKYDKKLGYNRGHLYRLYPPGPKQPITIRSVTGYLQLNIVNGPSVTMNLQPDGISWNPADIRMVTGCALDTPQLLMKVVNPMTNINTKVMMCALNHRPGSSYKAIYGFGLRQSVNQVWEPFIYLGHSSKPVTPSGPLNMMANVFDICLKTDCTQCQAGIKSLSINS